MSELLTASFWVQAAERAVKTFAQTAIASVGAAATIDAVDWRVVAGATVLSTVLSLLTSVASARVGGDSSPSLV